MLKYTTYGKFQEQMNQYYKRTGNRMQFNEMVRYMSQKDLLSDSVLPQPYISWDEDCTNEEFNQIIDSLVLSVEPNAPNISEVAESDIIPLNRDVFIIRHPRYTRPSLHSHNYFELNYVANGQCAFQFKNETKILREGELCIIAPSSEHDLVIEDESTVFSIMLRKSTFDTTFFTLLSRKDLLSYFFRTILQDDSHANYLLFFTQNSKTLTSYIRHALYECHKIDSYSNTCCICWINLMFSELLRSYSKTLQFYNYQMGSDFSLVLQYIQHNYQSLTLASLAQFFHYSEPHLCTLIKQNTGYNFTELIKRLRLTDAIDYLVNTNEKICEIAERVGYNSADHFSRVFRNTYHMSPVEYRKQNASTVEPFQPF
ncbi:two-component response regulator yesN [Lachnospiraceae bacterium KM106-2]|nr:two-component response regulator yesN [Lachnospiraceae bacterium KM106-2]